jgi:nicotinamidase-related amidase
MLEVNNTALVIIDIQGKLWNAMYDKEALLDNAQKLVKGMQVLGIPILLTEQNPAGLGPTLTSLTQLMPEVKPLSKFEFSCGKNRDFKRALNSLNRRQILICGIESHVCVYQTTLDLLSEGFQVQVVADVVSSRSVRNRDIALMRMQSEGAKMTVTEMAIYELMQTAENPKFKEMLKVVK